MATNTKNFTVKEFACKHCGENNIDQRVITMCQTIREALGVPVHVNSGYRCTVHNARVGGVKGSNHTKGLAADLSCSLGAARMFEAVKDLKSQGKLPDMDYCILYKRKNFIHIDCGGKRNTLYEIRA